MTKEEALSIWDDIYDKRKWAQDCFGTWMCREDYGNRDTFRIRPNGKGKKYKYGWEIDHIRPKNSFDNEEDADFPNNYEPMHFRNNTSKSDKIEFTIRESNYSVVECDICKKNGVVGYGIKNEEIGQRIDWKYIQNAYYVD